MNSTDFFHSCLSLPLVYSTISESFWKSFAEFYEYSMIYKYHSYFLCVCVDSFFSVHLISNYHIHIITQMNAKKRTLTKWLFGRGILSELQSKHKSYFIFAKRQKKTYLRLFMFQDLTISSECFLKLNSLVRNRFEFSNRAHIFSFMRIFYSHRSLRSVLFPPATGFE